MLIVGLGGGSMVHYLQQTDPGVKIDAVEIDPLVVKLAADMFGTKPSENVNIVTADGLKFIADAKDQTYDVIYMDAFLKPSADDRRHGRPARTADAAVLQAVATEAETGRRRGVQLESARRTRGRHSRTHRGVSATLRFSDVTVQRRRGHRLDSTRSESNPSSSSAAAAS